MPALTSAVAFVGQHRADIDSPDDPNLYSADEIMAYAVGSTVASAAISQVTSAAASGALDSVPVSTADSKAVSSGTRASIADSKAISQSVNTSVSDSKAESVSGNTSIADSKATSVATAIIIPVVSNVPGFLHTTFSTAVARTANSKMADIISVKDFGARGDGSTDDTTAIQNAINAAQTQGQAHVFFPSQNASTVYKTTAPLEITQSVWLIGANPQVTIEAFNLSAGEYVLDANVLAASNIQFVGIEKLTFMSNNSAPNLIRLANVSNVLFRDVALRTCNHGIVITGTQAYTMKFDKVVVTTGLVGSAIYFNAYTGGGHHKFDSCSFGGGTGITVDSTSIINNVVLDTCNFEGCTVNGIGVQGTVDGWVMTGCRSEGNTGTNTFAFVPSGSGNTVKGLTVIGGAFFSGGAEVSTFVLGGDTGTVRGFTFIGAKVNGYTGQFINLNGDGQSGIITGNRLDATSFVVNAVRPGVLVVNNENNLGTLGAVWNPPLTTPDITGSLSGATTTVLSRLVSAAAAVGIVTDSTSA